MKFPANIHVPAIVERYTLQSDLTTRTVSPLRQIDVAVLTDGDPFDDIFRRVRDRSGRFEFFQLPDTVDGIGRVLDQQSYELILVDARQSMHGTESIIAPLGSASPRSTIVLIVDDVTLLADSTRERLLETGVSAFLEPSDLSDDRVLGRLMAETRGFARRISEFARYRKMVDHTQDVITLLGPDGRVVFESPSVKEVLGYDPNELIGRDPFELVHEDDRAEVRSMYLTDRDIDGAVRAVEYRFRHADGSWRTLESRAKVFRQNDGAAGLILSTRDVSERRKTLEALRDRERQLAEAQRLTHIGSWQWKVESNELTWSDEMYRIYGFEPGSPLSFERYIEAVHPGDREMIRTTVAEAIEQAKPFSFTHRIVRADGEIRVIEGRGEVRTGGGSRVTEMYGTGHDITEIHESRSAIEESERRFRNLFESSPDAIMVFSAEGTVRDANPAAADFFETNRDWLTDRSFSELIPADRREEAQQQFERLLSGEDTIATEHFMLRDGGRRPVEIHANSIRHDDEKAVLFYMRDISERLETERTLRRLGRRQEAVLERERERISREVHDVLGQALTAIRMDVSWALSHIDDDRTPGRLEETGQRINETIETVRRIAHELRPGMLDDFGLSAAIEWHANQFSKRTGMAVRVAVGDSPPLDRDLATTVFRVFQELLTNVARHAEASEVEVSLTAPGENLVLSVRDDGKGMDLTDVTHNGSLGITGVRERLIPWGGRLDLTSSPGDGLRADVIVPRTITQEETI